MTNNHIINIAMQQSAWDIHCEPDDFLKSEPVLVVSHIGEKAKKYYKEPIACNFISYGTNVVASAKEEYRAIVDEYIHKFEFYHCFETPNLHWLDEKLAPYGYKVCFMAQYWLPDMQKLHRISCDYELRVLTPPDFQELYIDTWSNALCEDRKELDVLAVGAYDNGVLIGLAGCSADGEEMWQIGVDVLPAYRKRGVAAALVSNLAMEIIEKEKVPFYCCAWSNIRSSKTAIKAGFLPAWSEMTAKPTELVNEMNHG